MTRELALLAVAAALVYVAYEVSRATAEIAAARRELGPTIARLNDAKGLGALL